MGELTPASRAMEPKVVGTEGHGGWLALMASWSPPPFGSQTQVSCLLETLPQTAAVG